MPEPSVMVDQAVPAERGEGPAGRPGPKEGHAGTAPRVARTLHGDPWGVPVWRSF